MCTFYRRTNKWKWLWYGKNAHRTRTSRRLLTCAEHKYIKLAWVWVEAISKPYRNAKKPHFHENDKKINAETPAFDFVLYFFFGAFLLLLLLCTMFIDWTLSGAENSIRLFHLLSSFRHEINAFFLRNNKKRSTVWYECHFL